MPGSKTLDRVVQAFRDGIPRRSPNIWTDGRVLYSYSLPIAIRFESKNYGIVGRDEGFTRATQRHVNAAWDSIPMPQTRAPFTKSDLAGYAKRGTD